MSQRLQFGDFSIDINERILLSPVHKSIRRHLDKSKPIETLIYGDRGSGNWVRVRKFACGLALMEGEIAGPVTHTWSAS